MHNLLPMSDALYDLFYTKCDVFTVCQTPKHSMNANIMGLAINEDLWHFYK